jgi:hypothetical protein
MKRLATIAFATLLVAACFDDPTSSLRNGPAAIQLSRNAVVLEPGDSILVEARLVDAQGNLLPIPGATWATDNSSIATVALDAVQLTNDASSRAYIKGVAGASTAGGVTYVRVSGRGINDSVRVATVDGIFPTGFAVVSGDTITVTANANFRFDATASAVTLGGTSTYLLSRTATVIKVLARGGYTGVVTVSDVFLTGNNSAVDYPVGSYDTPDNVTVAGATLPVANVTVRAGPLGANTEVKIVPPAGMTLNTNSDVVFGSSAGTALVRTADSIVAITPTANTAAIKVTNLTITATKQAADSLRTATAVNVAAAPFPGTIVHGGTQRMLDTLYIIGGAVADFRTTGATLSNVTLNGATALVLRRSADTLYVLAPFAGTSTVRVSNVVVSGVTIPALTTSGTTTISTTTGDINEPGNDALATATPVAFTGAADTITVYGTIDCEDDGTACPGNGDVSDWYSFALPATASIRAILEFPGNGSANTAGAAGNYCGNAADLVNPDIDVSIRTSAGAGVPRTGGAGLVQPEISSTNAAQAAGTYTIRVDAWCTITPAVYRLRILRF